MIRLGRELDAAHLAELLSADNEWELRPPAPIVRDPTRPRLVLLPGGAERDA